MDPIHTIERVEFRVNSPKATLTGLDQTLHKLEALGAALKSVQSQLAGMGTNTAFKLSARQYQQFGYNADGKPSLGVGQVSRRAGFGPEARAHLQADARRMVAEVETAQRKIEAVLSRTAGKGKAHEKVKAQLEAWKGFLPFANASASSFKNSTQAGLFLGGGLDPSKLKMPKGFSFTQGTRQILEQGWAKVALANQAKPAATLNSILNGTGGGAAGSVTMPANLAAAVGEALKAKTAAATAAAAPADDGDPKPRKRKGSAGPPPPPASFGSDGTLLEQQHTTFPGTEIPDRLRQTRRVGVGQTVTETVQGESLTRTLKDRLGKRVVDQFNSQLEKLATEYGRELPGASGAAGAAGLRRHIIQQAGALYKSNPALAGLGQGERMREFVGGDLPRAAASARKQSERVLRKLAQRREIAERDRLRASRQQAEAELTLMRRPSNRENGTRLNRSTLPTAPLELMDRSGRRK